MAGKSLSSLNFILGADIKQFQTKMRRAESDLQKVGKKMQSIGKTMSLAVTAPLLAIGTGSVLAFDKQIQAVSGLSTQLEMNGKNVAKLLPEYKKFASELQNVTTVGDEMSLELMRVAETMGSIDSKRAARDAIGLSKALKVDLNAAIRMVVLAQQGEYTMLNRYVPALRSAKTETEKYTIAQKLFADGFEKAKTEAKEGLGPLKQIRNTLGDLSEDFGKIISEAIAPFIEKLKGVVEWMKGLDDSTKKIIAIVGGLAAAIGPVLLVLGFLATNIIPGLVVAFGVLKGAFLSLSTAIMANPVTALITLLGLAATAMIAFSGRTNDAEDAQWKLGNALKNVNKELGQQIWTTLVSGFKRAGEGFVKLEGSVDHLRKNISKFSKEELQSLELFLKDKLSNASREAANETDNLTRSIINNKIDNYNDALKSVGNELKKFKTKTVEVTEKQKSNFQTVVSGIINYEKLGKTVQNIANKFKTIPDKLPFKNAFAYFDPTEWNFDAVETELNNQLQRLNSTLKNGLENLTITFAEGIGNLITGDEDIEGFGKNILASIGGFLKQMGSALIVYAGLMEAFKATFTNPLIAIAVGIATIAAGQVLMNLASKGPEMKEGGVIPPGFANDSYPAMLSSGETVIPAPQALPSFSNELNVTGHIEAAGDKLLVIFDRAKRMKGRLG